MSDIHFYTQTITILGTIWIIKIILSNFIKFDNNKIIEYWSWIFPFITITLLIMSTNIFLTIIMSMSIGIMTILMCL